MKLRTAIRLMVAWILYGCSFVVPRSQTVWVCIGWHHNPNGELFADNSKYFFLYAHHHLPDIRVVWISPNDQLAAKLRARGMRAYSQHSFPGIYYALRARYTFVDAFLKLENWRFSGGSRIIQLWHGKGMKKTGHDSDYSLKRYNRLLFPNLFVTFYRLIASSEHTAKLMASTFRAPQDRILVTGLPRNDVLLSEIPDADIDAHKELAQVVSDARASGAQKVILYAPTFRTDGSNPLDTLDIIALEAFLTEHKYHLILSLHPKFARKAHTQHKTPHISHIAPGYDIYPALASIDILITDYSSLYVDFLLLNKPMVFYTYDLETYKKNMGLHEDFDNLTPGPHPRTFEELLRALSDTDTYQEARQKALGVLYTHIDGQASARIAKALIE